MIVVAAAGAFGYNLIAKEHMYAGIVTQGDFRIGYRVIPEYLWYAEGWLFPLFLGGAAATALFVWRRRRKDRAWWWLGGLVLLAGGLIFFSDVVPKFVVHGRLTRGLVPFFCLVTAYAVERLVERRSVPQFVWGGAVATVLAVAAWNFHYPLLQVFPRQFRRLAESRVFHSQQQDGYGLFRVLFAESLWGKNVNVTLPPHVVMLRRRHPLQFRPYQFEGYSRKQREAIDSHDVSMRLIRLTAKGTRAVVSLPRGDPQWGNYPGPVRLRLTFSSRHPGEPQPLIVSGTFGRADFFYFVPEPDGRIRFGYDDGGGGGGFRTAPLSVDFAQPHELLVGLGALYPPDGASTHPPTDLAELRHYLVVVLDGRTLLSRRVPYHPAPSATITFGANLVEHDAAGHTFLGSFARIERAGLNEMTRRIGVLAMPGIAHNRPASWRGAPGPVRMEVVLPRVPVGAAQPLLAAGRPGAGGLLYWMRDGDDLIRLGYAHPGRDTVLSEPLTVRAGAATSILVSLGSLMPPTGSPYYRDHPDERHLQDVVYAAVDGRASLQVGQPYEKPAHEATLGVNGVDNAVAAPYFSGDVLSIHAVDPAAVLRDSLQLANKIAPRRADWGGYPGPVRLRLRFGDPPAGISEPVVVSGVPGGGDFLYIRFEGRDRLRFGFDNGTGRDFRSPMIAFDPKAGHEITVSLGSLMPEAEAFYPTHPALARLRNLLWVAFDGRTVLTEPASFHPTAPERITLAANFIGGTACRTHLDAQIMGVAPLPEATIRAKILGMITEGPKAPGRLWEGYSGPVSMKVQIPNLAPGVSEPLLTTGRTGVGDCLFLRRDADGRFRLGFDHWGVHGALLSAPFTEKPGSVHVFMVSIGSLFPPGSSALFAAHPDWRFLRAHVLVAIDGRLALQGPRPAYTSPLADIDYGENRIGISTASGLFSGRISDVKTVPVPEILRMAVPTANGPAPGDR